MKPLIAILLLLTLALPAPAARAEEYRSRPSGRDRRGDREAVVRPGGPGEDRSRVPERTSSDPQFDAFRLISDRNIFSANRRRMASDDRPTTRPTLPPTEAVRLTGAWIHDAGTSQICVAFFEGSKPEYNASRRLGESIAGYRIAAIRTEGVRLVQDGSQIDIPVGGGISRQTSGKWQVALVSGFAESSGTGPPSSTPSASTTASTGTATATAAGGSASDVLKRMMERRRQQTEK